METITMITKMTGRTVVVSSCALSLRGAVALADNGLGLDATGLCSVSGLGNTALGRDERPTKASKAAVAVAKHGDYAQAVGAGHWMKQDEQQISKPMTAFIGAGALRMWVYRGPEAWRERT